MSELTLLLLTVAFGLLPTPNTTAYCIKIIGLIICVILSQSNVNWQYLLDYFYGLNEQYYLFLMEKINNENTARTILSLTYIIAIQPIIVGGYILYKRTENF